MTFAQDDEAARAARAKRLREEIEELTGDRQPRLLQNNHVFEF